jgi:hypothetical protein
MTTSRPLRSASAAEDSLEQQRRWCRQRLRREAAYQGPLQ